MKTPILKTISIAILGLALVSPALAQEHDHAASPNAGKPEMMQQMMQKMRHCMMQMKEGEQMGMQGHGGHAGSASENDMMKSMMNQMMSRMETCMNQMGDKEDMGADGNHDGGHQH